MKIGIIGAGISGLSTALTLAQNGHEVDIFQRESTVGGLISTFDFDGLSIEHFYHFLCRKDEGYFNLCKELGLADRLRFRKARTGFYYDGKLYPFTSPLDLLRFSGIPFTQRVRFGIFALEARMRTEWSQLDEIAAKPWLIDRVGRQTYEVVWNPLLALKFGKYHESISAAWVWHRLHRIAQSKGRMGYLEGGTALLIDTLIEKLASLGVTIHPGRPVEGLQVEDDRVQGVTFAGNDAMSCDQVVSTVPLSVLGKLLPAQYQSYARELESIEYIGVACVVLKLKRPVTNNFWLNVNDPRILFNGVIEYTNLNPLGKAHGHILYVPYYVPTDHELFTMSDDSLFAQSWDAVKLIQPKLSDDDLLAHHVSRAAYAQAICTTGFLKALPNQRAPIRGLHLLDSTFLYPEDRSQSGQILMAQKCARQIMEQNVP